MSQGCVGAEVPNFMLKTSRSTVDKHELLLGATSLFVFRELSFLTVCTTKKYLQSPCVYYFACRITICHGVGEACANVVNV